MLAFFVLNVVQSTRANTLAPAEITAAAPGASHGLDFKMPVSLTSETNIKNPHDVDWASDTSLEIDPELSINDKFKLGGVFSVTKNLNGEQTATLDDGQLSAGLKARPINGVISYSVDNLYVLPLSHDSRVRDGLITSITLRPNIIFNLDRAGIKGLTLIARLGVTRHVHEFITTTLGKSNAEYTVSPRIDVAYSPLTWLSISLVNQYSIARTYGGSVYQNFRLIQELDFQVSEKISLNVGQRNQGGALKADGQSSNIKIFSAQTSLVYAGMSYEF